MPKGEKMVPYLAPGRGHNGPAQTGRLTVRRRNRLEAGIERVPGIGAVGGQSVRLEGQVRIEVTGLGW